MPQYDWATMTPIDIIERFMSVVSDGDGEFKRIDWREGLDDALKQHYTAALRAKGVDV